MPVEKVDAQSGWRKDDDDGAGGRTEKKHHHGKKHHKAAQVPLLPSQSFKSTRMTAVVVAG